MPKRCTVEIAGCEGRPLLIDLPGLFTSVRVRQDGRDVPVERKTREFKLLKNDGTEVTAKFTGDLLLPVQKLVIGEITHELEPPIPWFAYAWFCLPMILVFAGGLIGGFVGAIASLFGIQVYRSNLPAIVRYAFGALITIMAFVTYLLLGTVANYALSGGKETSLARSGIATTTNTAAPLGKAPVSSDTGSVSFDNGTDQDITVTGAGLQRVIPAQVMVTMQLPKGNHEFVFSDGKTEVDRIKVDIRPERVAMLNPGGQRAYTIFTEVYGKGNTSPPIAPRKIAGERVVYADFGPETPFPQMISVKVSVLAFGSSKEEFRTKILREFPAEPTVTFALKFLSNDAQSFRHVPTGFADRCWQMITEKATERRVQDGLLALVERKLWTKESLAILRAQKVTIPDASLLGWLQTKLRDTGDFARANAAVQWMIADGKLDVCIENFGSFIPEIMLECTRVLVREKLTPEQLRKILDACLAANHYESDKAARLVLQMKEFALDAALATRLDAHLQSIQRAKDTKDTTRVREEFWSATLKELYSTRGASLPGDLVAARMLPAAKAGDSAAIEAMLASGNAAGLVPLYSAMDESKRRLLVQLIQTRQRANTKLADAEIAIIHQALDQPETAADAFRTLATQAATNDKVLDLLSQKIMTCTDLRRRDDLDMKLAQALVSGSPPPNVLLHLLQKAPSRMTVKLTLVALTASGVQPAQRKENISAIVPICRQYTRTEQRLWAIEFLVNQWTRQDPSVIAFLDGLLSAENADERLISARARLATLCTGGREIERIEALLPQFPQDESAKLAKTFEVWADQGIDKMALDQPGAMRRLVTLAAHPRESIAESAARRLPHAEDKKADPAIIAEMAATYAKCPSAKVRQTLFDRLRSESPRGIQFCRGAIRDPDPGLRWNAFRHLASYYGRLRERAAAAEGIQFLKGIANAEPDRKTKDQMQQALVSSERNPALRTAVKP